MFYPYNTRRPSKMEFGTKRIPDYTEMAYKEAVGKLRYFLSGNYSPSVRSYVGSASIKNLDEPDLDKKYPGYLPDYRPRPKLTTKYTTLYADSLSNYNPANVGSAPPAPPAPAPALASTSPEVVHFIQKQEEYIEQLERESQYCRDELNTLLGKVKEVISENSQLHSAKHGELLSRVLQGAGSETDELRDEGSTGADSDHQVSWSEGLLVQAGRSPVSCLVTLSCSRRRAAVPRAAGAGSETDELRDEGSTGADSDHQVRRFEGLLVQEAGRSPVSCLVTLSCSRRRAAVPRAAGAGSETDELRDEGSTGADSDHQHSPSKPRRRSSRPRTPKMEGSSIMFESQN
ncbi:hypothetical protein JYU34_022149 [Plutella xylostella]|uniref:Uncharacterized protein n=1 Tax=Plutella xylostella TaxID=51655 RepID=A0ABQ7PQF0_PLUXY|nr:hypothetical protein JYU34_022149 [Plutella xylostella]